MSAQPLHTDPAVAAGIDQLLSLLPEGSSPDLLGQLLAQVMQLPGKGLHRGELKLLSSSLADFSRSFEAFDTHRGSRKISIFGSARSPEGSEIYDHCHRLSAAAVARGWMVITGAGPGIMQAGNQGATRERSFGVSIDLPFEASANEYIDGDSKHVHFKYFFSRKLAFVKESDAIVLYPGGFGTMDEGFESLTLLQTGKCDPLPVILVDVPGGDYWPAWERYVRENLLGRGLISPYDRNLYRYTTSTTQALDEIEQFYRCYHSLRYVDGDYTILRLRQAPSPELIELLNTRYADLLVEGSRFELLSAPHPEEENEPEVVRALPRIGFRYIQRRLGRLRRLIDDLNLAAQDQDCHPATDPPHGSGALHLPASE